MIGGQFVRSWIIVSRGGKLQKQGQVHSRWTASTEGQEAHQQPNKAQRGKEKEELILQKASRRKRKEKVMQKQRK